MNVDRQLATEILEQLKDDILSLGWIVQIARLQNSDRTEFDSIVAVVNCVTELQSQRRIVVGNARDSGDLVLIDPWPESGQDLLTRMTKAIEETDGHERSFCFWIQLAEHFEKLVKTGRISRAGKQDMLPRAER